MYNYQQMIEQLNRNQDKLKEANNKSLDLKESSNDIKDVISKLRPTITNKENVVLKKEDKDKLLNYIDKVDNTNNEYQNIQELSITLKDVDKELKDNKNTIKVLTENNNAYELRNKNLNSKIKEKDNKIDELEKENLSLKSIIYFLKERFKKLIKFLTDKMFDRNDQDLYYGVSRNLYTHGVIKDNDMNEIYDDYKYSKDKELKNKNDDFEL